MSRPITLFSNFGQKENRTTSYCLLVLKLIYEENPKLLADFFEALIGADRDLEVGVAFLQQQRKSDSVPDGVLKQPAFTIYLETKNFDWFHDDQLFDHATSLKDSPGFRLLLALSNFESLPADRFKNVTDFIRDKLGGEVEFAAVTFEQFVDAIPFDDLSKNLADTVEEFREYLDSEDLLPTWKYRLDVVNSASSADQVRAEHVYLCPATGGAYAHRRSRFFGLYQGKRVTDVAEIEAVVEVRSDGAAVKWSNVATPPDALLERAVQQHKKCAPDMLPALVFLLGELVPTDFRKSSRGGMFGSKKYFEVEAESARELAEQLRGRAWESYHPGG